LNLGRELNFKSYVYQRDKKASKIESLIDDQRKKRAVIQQNYDDIHISITKHAFVIYLKAVVFLSCREQANVPCFALSGGIGFIQYDVKRFQCVFFDPVEGIY